MMKSLPVVIIGGGMVGATAAVALCQLGIAVTLVEANTIDNKRAIERPYDLRVSAIQRSSEQLLKSLGIWPEIEARRLQAFQHMVIQDWTGFHTKLSAQDLHEPNLGYLIENDVITAAAWDLLRQHPLCHLIQASPINAQQAASGLWHIQLSNDQILTTDLLIGADGAHSQVRQWLGIPQAVQDYHQHCIVGTVNCERDHQQTCWQHYRPEGPFALLPLTQNTCSIAWYVTPAEADHWLAATTEQQSHAMTEASSNMLGKLTPISALSAFPLRKQQAQHYAQSNSLLIGDAAHTVHPQAGQGVNLGMLDIIAMQRIFQHALTHHQPLGDLRVLTKIERARRHDASLVQYGMEGVNWLFSQSAFPQHLRQWAQPLTQLTPVRACLAAQGLYGRLTGIQDYD